jgi:hypothetical protein
MPWNLGNERVREGLARVHVRVYSNIVTMVFVMTLTFTDLFRFHDDTLSYMRLQGRRWRSSL